MASNEDGVAREGDDLDENTLEALPYGPFYPERHRTLDTGLRTWVEEQAQLSLGYVEQLYTFGDRGRDPREKDSGSRLLSIGYLALAQEEKPAGAGEALWQNWYRYFPWEDWRAGKPEIISETIEPGLEGKVVMKQFPESKRMTTFPAFPERFRKGTCLQQWPSKSYSGPNLRGRPADKCTPR